MKITSFEGLCNLGNNIDEIYQKAINGDISCFQNIEGVTKDGRIRVGVIDSELPEIENPDYNIRCNRLILKNIELLEKKGSSLQELISRYGKDRVGVIVATTNSGVEEYETTRNEKHNELGNPAKFLSEHLDLDGFYTTVSTACSSGIKAFSLARDLMKNNISDAIIIVSVDPLTKLPIHGFNSLEVLSDKPSVPLSKNRRGMNIGEACSLFILESDDKKGIKVMGIGESSDIYHATTPNPEAVEVVQAIKLALDDAKIEPDMIDYINTHGTGTIPNDIMESTAISKVFPNTTPTSSTKPMTGHCLGAGAGIETALCCKLLESFDGRLFPHVYDEDYDSNLQKIRLVKNDEKYPKCRICMCNSFGFGGTNAIMILGI